MLGDYGDWLYDQLHDDEEAFMAYCKEHPWRLRGLRTTWEEVLSNDK